MIISQRGEIATLLTIGAFVVIAGASVVSSLTSHKSSTTARQYPNTTSASAAEIKNGCTKYPNIPAPNGLLHWEADCGNAYDAGKSCYVPKPLNSKVPFDPNANCPQNKDPNEIGYPSQGKPGYINPKTSNWCYGFDGPFGDKRDFRCLMLRYGPRPQEAAPTNSQPSTLQPTSPKSVEEPKIYAPTAEPTQSVSPQCNADVQKIYYDNDNQICTVLAKAGNDGISCSVRNDKEFPDTHCVFKEQLPLGNGLAYYNFNCDFQVGDFKQIGALDFKQCMHNWQDMGKWQNLTDNPAPNMPKSSTGSSSGGSSSGGTNSGSSSSGSSSSGNAQGTFSNGDYNSGTGTIGQEIDNANKCDIDNCKGCIQADGCGWSGTPDNGKCMPQPASNPDINCKVNEWHWWSCGSYNQSGLDKDTAHNAQCHGGTGSSGGTSSGNSGAPVPPGGKDIEVTWDLQIPKTPGGHCLFIGSGVGNKACTVDDFFHPLHDPYYICAQLPPELGKEVLPDSKYNVGPNYCHVLEGQVLQQESTDLVYLHYAIIMKFHVTKEEIAGNIVPRYLIDTENPRKYLDLKDFGDKSPLEKFGDMVGQATDAVTAAAKTLWTLLDVANSNKNNGSTSTTQNPSKPASPNAGKGVACGSDTCLPTETCVKPQAGQSYCSNVKACDSSNSPNISTAIPVHACLDNTEYSCAASDKGGVVKRCPGGCSVSGGTITCNTSTSSSGGPANGNGQPNNPNGGTGGSPTSPSTDTCGSGGCTCAIPWSKNGTSTSITYTSRPWTENLDSEKMVRVYGGTGGFACTADCYVHRGANDDYQLVSCKNFIDPVSADGDQNTPGNSNGYKLRIINKGQGVLTIKAITYRSEDATSNSGFSSEQKANITEQTIGPSEIGLLDVNDIRQTKDFFGLVNLTGRKIAITYNYVLPEQLADGNYTTITTTTPEIDVDAKYLQIINLVPVDPNKL